MTKFVGPGTDIQKFWPYDPATGNPSSLGGVTLQTAGTAVEKSATVSSAAVDLAAAKTSRTYFSFQNTSKTGYVWVRENADAAVGTGQLLGPGGTYISESLARVSVIKDTGSPDCYCFGYEY